MTAPPENILNIPSKPFLLEAMISLKEEGSIPAAFGEAYLDEMINSAEKALPTY